MYVKDLRIFKGIDLKDIILVDNAVYSFGLQLNNGIPMTPFKENKNDNEFKFLKRFLLDIRNSPDFRETLKEAFHFDDLFHGNYNFDSFIEYYDYEDCEIEHENDEEWADNQEDLDSAGPQSHKRQEEMGCLTSRL